jgi:hypothetical protein
VSDWTYQVLGMPRLLAKMDRFHGRNLDRIVGNAQLDAVKTLIGPIRREAPKRTGKMARSVRATRLTRQDAPGAAVGPRIWYRHFPIRGTRRGVQPNDFVGRGVRGGLRFARFTFLTRLHRDLTR